MTSARVLAFDLPFSASLICVVPQILQRTASGTASGSIGDAIHMRRPLLPRAVAAVVCLAWAACAISANAATYTVISTGDTGSGSGNSGDLRYTITQANLNPGSTINFSVTGTIKLTSTLPFIDQNLTIYGHYIVGELSPLHVVSPIMRHSNNQQPPNGRLSSIATSNRRVMPVGV